jgi:predicted DNA-binding transcriptional regulator AlpA
MEKIVLSESELAKHWGVSPKTLQRWRSEGRGPRYLKLSKRVVYPMVEIRAFESNALYASTSERASDVTTRSSASLLTAKEAAAATSLPAYMFSSKRIREAVGLPCVHINSSVRFNLEEIMNWARRNTNQLDE